MIRYIVETKEVYLDVDGHEYFAEAVYYVQANKASEAKQAARHQIALYGLTPRRVIYTSVRRDHSED